MCKSVNVNVALLSATVQVLCNGLQTFTYNKPEIPFQESKQDIKNKIFNKKLEKHQSRRFEEQRKRKKRVHYRIKISNC